MQVSCAATGSIIVRLMQLAPVANGYAKLALLNVAGTGAVSTVALAPTGTQVRVFAPMLYLRQACPCPRCVCQVGLDLRITGAVSAAALAPPHGVEF